jgi:DNA-binding NtrC family response regulator
MYFTAILSLTELERRAIVDALEHTQGDRAKAARLLGISRTTLYRKLKQYQKDTVPEPEPATL